MRQIAHSQLQYLSLECHFKMRQIAHSQLQYLSLERMIMYDYVCDDQLRLQSPLVSEHIKDVLLFMLLVVYQLIPLFKFVLFCYSDLLQDI